MPLKGPKEIIQSNLEKELLFGKELANGARYLGPKVKYNQIGLDFFTLKMSANTTDAV